MFTNKAKKILAILMSVILVFSAIPFGMIASAATMVEVLDGQVSITDNLGTGKVSDGVVTITAKGSLFATKTNTITVANESGTKAKLSFSYVASASSSFKIQDAAAISSGTFSSILEAGSTVKISIVSNSGLSNTTATLTLSDFSLVEVTDFSNITFNYDKALGSIKVDGVSVEDGYIAENVQSETGAALVATPVSGARFLGWINEEHSILSTDTSYTLKPAQDMTVKALFVGIDSVPHFAVGKAVQSYESTGIKIILEGKRYYYTVTPIYFFDNLNSAIEKADTNNNVIVLMNDGVLPAGNYTIPKGITLLIPFDNSNTMYTTEASSDSNYVTPTAYRTLTLASGASINVNGAISLSAKHRQTNGAKEGGGSPTGNVSFINMSEDSNIIVNNGGALYAYGFITGSGNVIANSGASVYENFQMMDFRGGDQSTQMKNGVFPVSQYYVQNIEVPLTIHHGAKEYSYTTINMQGGNWPASIDFISSENAMFTLSSGSVIKRYDGTSDRLLVEVNGNMQISGIKMNMGLSDIDSKEFELPINNNITVKVNADSNITLNHDIALLPGAKIIVDEGAQCTLGENYNIYLYDSEQWGYYCGASNKKFIPVVYAPSKSYTRIESDLVDAEMLVNGKVDASKGYVYSTAGGANVHSEGNGVAIVKSGEQIVTYQVTQRAEVKDSVYNEISLTPVKFKNADGSYESLTSSENTTYTYAHDKWWVYDGEHKVTSVVKEPTCNESGYTEHTCPCGYKLTDSTVPPTNEHSYKPVKKEPTCTESGSITYTCSVCKDSYTENGKEALGHSYGDWIIEENATHSSVGSMYQECSGCNDKVYDSIPKIICDYNGDGNVNGTELAMLRKFLLGTEKPDDATKKLFDMNDNGELSIVDLVNLKKYIAEIN